MKKEEIIYQLISTGEYIGDIEEINDINKILRQLHFEAVQWYDRSCYILKNVSEKYVISIYSEENNEEVKRIFEAIVYNKSVESSLLDSLMHNKWIERDKNGYKLSRRTQIQFKDYILDLDGRYQKCSICGYLVDSCSIHEFCKKMLNQNQDVVKLEEVS